MSFTRQQAPLGLGHAVWCARELVGNEPFAVLLPDMLMRGEPGCLAQMVAVYNETGGNVIAVEECDPADTDRYGIVGVGDDAPGGAFRITSMVEKPAPEVAPSNLYINGRYILQPAIFAHLAKQQRGAGNEIQLTDAMIALADSEPFYGCRFGAARSTAARSSASLPPTSPSGSSATTSAKRSKAEMRALLDR
jgi:UTP--glucose-1-phosphate uridylyltransferase